MNKIISCSLLFIFFLPVAASTYEAKDLLQYEHFTLPNGFRVILNSRGSSKTASLRLNVRVGASNFSCDKRQTPHYLEHMLFDGTKSMTREQIKQAFDDNGIIWNATTTDEYTNYKLEIYAPRIKTAIDVLFDMIANSTLPKERFIQTRDIINQENSPTPWVFKKLIEMGVGRDSENKVLATLLPESGYRCDGQAPAKNISIGELWETYKKYYVPQNMTIILVGGFDAKKVKKQLTKTFGQLTKTNFVSNRYQFKMLNGDDPLYSGTWNPLISEQTFIGYAYAIPGLDSVDYIPLQFLDNYLYERLFKVLRMEQAISYGPTVEIISRQKHGAFIVGSYVKHDKVDLAKKLLLEEIGNLKNGLIDVDFFNKTKQAMLISLVHSYESNVDYAGTYEYSLTELDAFNKFLSSEEIYTEITPIKLSALTNKYFINSNRIRMLGTPSLSSVQATSILVAILLLFLYPLYRFFSHKFKRVLEIKK